MEDVPNLINIGPTNPIQILNQHQIFWRFYICPSNDTFNKNKKILIWVLGLHSKDRKSTGVKANMSNPKVNRGCTPLTANRTSADCVQISLGPSIPYIPLRVYHTGGFNAMDGLLWIGPLGRNFSEILIYIQIFAFMKIHLKMPSAKQWPFCLGLNVLSVTIQREDWCWAITLVDLFTTDKMIFFWSWQDSGRFPIGVVQGCIGDLWAPLPV